MPRAIETADPVDIHVGERLRAERIRGGLSQQDLGAALGVSFQQIQKYERGTNRISASMLARAATALTIRVADLFPIDDPDAAYPDRIEIGAIKGGYALIESFARMSPARRALLLQVAETFVATEEQAVSSATAA